MTATATHTAPVRKSARRLRWFLAVFQDQLAGIEAETGNRYEVDEAALAAAFADWLKDFQAQKPEHSEEKAAYVGFAAGLMLRALIKHAPIRAISKPGPADEASPAQFWPEGYAYVAFCLNVRGLVLTQDFQSEQALSEALNDVQTWWSFKENVAEDPGLALGFLDLFAGDTPDWETPDLFRAGRALKAARQLYEVKELENKDG